MKYLVISLLLSSALISCAENKIVYTRNTPFFVDEWNICYISCADSMPKNLKSLEFSEDEIAKVDIKAKCVDFCRKSLLRKRGVEVD
jgi:hypothetical protein